jgi:hypothetical protein
MTKGQGAPQRTDFKTLGEIVINGRPDFGNPEFGKTYAKTFPKYVYSTNHQGYLIHAVREVEFHWWQANMDKMIRLRNPRMIAHTICGMSKFIQTAGRIRASFCAVPKPDAVLCKKCLGEAMSTFSRRDPQWRERVMTARVKLGCIAITENGGSRG